MVFLGTRGNLDGWLRGFEPRLLSLTREYSCFCTEARPLPAAVCVYWRGSGQLTRGRCTRQAKLVAGTTHADDVVQVLSPVGGVFTLAPTFNALIIITQRPCIGLIRPSDECGAQRTPGFSHDINPAVFGERQRLNVSSVCLRTCSIFRMKSV